MTILPPGESLRRALTWITEAQAEEPSRDRLSLVEEAATRFDLSPAEEEWLLRMIAETKPSPRP